MTCSCHPETPHDELVEKIAALEKELVDVKAKWAVDDHETRLLRFALYEIDSATKRGGVAQVLIAIEDALRAARLIAGHSTPAVTNLLAAVKDVLKSSNLAQRKYQALEAAYAPFKEAA